MASKTWNVDSLQMKRGTTAKWKANTTPLKKGEIGIDTDLGIFKIGDGTSLWSALKLMFEPKGRLEDYSWSDIDTISQAGLAPKYFNVGDEKNITLSTGESVTLVILGFSHDLLRGSNYDKAGITFGMKHLLATIYPMNSSNTNAGGWESSVMKSSTMATLLSYLPSDLKSAIKTVEKNASAGSQSTTITTSTDSLFLFSEIEVFGTTINSAAGEGEQYEYFKKFVPTPSSRIRNLSNGTGSATTWWLRSPRTSNSTSFCGVNGYGTASNINASGSRSVTFGFCI